MKSNLVWFESATKANWMEWDMACITKSAQSNVFDKSKSLNKVLGQLKKEENSFWFEKIHIFF